MALGSKVNFPVPQIKTEPIEHLVTPPLQTVRLAYVGIGNQGSGHFRNMLRIEGVEIVAVCDIREERTLWAQEQCEKAGKPKPTAYIYGDHLYRVSGSI